MISKKIRKIIAMVLINLCFIEGAYAKVFVFIGPSGVGKSTLMKKLLASEFNSEELISYTTRPMRDQEENMKDYFFISMDEYKIKEKNNEFILSTEVHGNMYGVSKKHINDALISDRNLICSLNTKAAKKLKSLYGERVVTIFISPPSFDELKKRLTKRGEKKASSDIRLENAKKELKEQNSFDYKVINDDIGEALESLKKIFFLEATLELVVKQSVPPLKSHNSIRIMSYNIRMAPHAEDDRTENSWHYRLPKVNMIFNEYIPDIVGTQEVSVLQMESLEKSHYPRFGSRILLMVNKAEKSLKII